MRNFIQEGNTIDVTMPYAVLSGGGVKVGSLFGIACDDYAISVVGGIKRSGVFDVTKDTSVFATGDPVYWDDTAKKITSTVGSNLLVGIATAAALTGDTTGRVALYGVPGFSGQASGVKVAHMLYDFAVDGGTTCVPANSDTIPDNAVVFGGIVNSTTAVTAVGSATVALGTATGSAANSILTATGKASLGLDALVVPTCVATPFKMTAAVKIQVTIATGPLTAGVIEAWVLYTTANA